MATAIRISVSLDLRPMQHLRKQTTRSKILRKALDKATQPVNKAAKRNAPRQTGTLRRAIGRRIRVYRHSGNVVVLIGPRRGFKREVVVDGKRELRNPTNYAHLAEEDKPFLRPAWESHRQRVNDTANRLIVEGVEAEARKVSR